VQGNLGAHEADRAREDRLLGQIRLMAEIDQAIPKWPVE
jgi:hypothetical protein